jgi:hypothetical protein
MTSNYLLSLYPHTISLYYGTSTIFWQQIVQGGFHGENVGERGNDCTLNLPEGFWLV